MPIIYCVVVINLSVILVEWNMSETEVLVVTLT